MGGACVTEGGEGEYVEGLVRSRNERFISEDFGVKRIAIIKMDLKPNEWEGVE
jgi:hypothetical protein